MLMILMMLMIVVMMVILDDDNRAFISYTDINAYTHFNAINTYHWHAMVSVDRLAHHKLVSQKYYAARQLNLLLLLRLRILSLRLILLFLVLLLLLVPTT